MLENLLQFRKQVENSSLNGHVKRRDRFVQYDEVGP
jgi:hypothetical protein